MAGEPERIRLVRSSSGIDKLASCGGQEELHCAAGLLSADTYFECNVDSRASMMHDNITGSNHDQSF